MTLILTYPLKALSTPSSRYIPDDVFLYLTVRRLNFNFSSSPYFTVTIVRYSRVIKTRRNKGATSYATKEDDLATLLYEISYTITTIARAIKADITTDIRDRIN